MAEDPDPGIIALSVNVYNFLCLVENMAVKACLFSTVQIYLINRYFPVNLIKLLNVYLSQ